MVRPNPHLSQLPVYEPGRPIEDVARDFGLNAADIIKLASNENPLGPSPKAIEAIRNAISSIHFYPDGNGFQLRSAISKKLNVRIDQVVLGNGSNEIIEFLGHAYLSPGDEIVVSQYAFVVYEIVGKTFQASVVEVPALNYGHDLSRMLAAITPKTKLVFVANPNNPTGTTLAAAELNKFIESVPKHVLVVLDEAYYEFLNGPLDTTALITTHPNLVVMRTFSKAQGLAGLRIGYGIAAPEVASNLQKVRQPFNSNLVAQAAALAALEDSAHIEKTVRLTNEGLHFFYEEFKKRKLEYVPSSGNFVMLKVGDGKMAFDFLMRKGVIVRPLGGYKLPEWIRVTIGTLQQNVRFLEVLDQFLAS